MGRHEAAELQHRREILAQLRWYHLPELLKSKAWRLFRHEELMYLYRNTPSTQNTVRAAMVKATKEWLAYHDLAYMWDVYMALITHENSEEFILTHEDLVMDAVSGDDSRVRKIAFDLALDAWRKAKTPEARRANITIQGPEGPVHIAPLTRAMFAKSRNTVAVLKQLFRPSCRNYTETLPRWESLRHYVRWGIGPVSVDSMYNIYGPCKHGWGAFCSRQLPDGRWLRERSSPAMVLRAFLRSIKLRKKRELGIHPLPEIRTFVTLEGLRRIWYDDIGSVLLLNTFKPYVAVKSRKQKAAWRLHGETNHKEAGRFFTAMQLCN